MRNPVATPALLTALLEASGPSGHEGPPAQVFNNPKSERCRQFLTGKP